MPSVLDNLPHVFQGALTMFEAFRKLGFPAESLYLGINNKLIEPGNTEPNAEPTLCVHAYKNGEEFITTIGAIPCAMDELTFQWEQATAAWNTAAPEDAGALYDRVLGPDARLELLMALAKRGMLDAAITDVALIN